MPAILSSALARLVSTTHAERYLVLWQPTDEPIQVVAARGFDPARVFISEPLCLTLLEESLESNEVRWSGDSRREPSSSLLLSGIKSYCCVPLTLPGGRGLLYADDRHNMARIRYTDVLNLINLVTELGSRATPRSPEQARVSPVPRAHVQPPRSASPPPQAVIKLKLAEQASMFRILGAFIQSGIPLLQGFDAVAAQGETRALREVAARSHVSLLNGNRLSESLGRFGRFDPIVIPLIRAAESSGRLNHVFRMLSVHLDEKRERALQLKSALVYPSVVLGAGAVMILTVPPLILRDQLHSFGSSNLPLPTRLLLFMSTFWFWALLTLALALIVWVTRIPGWSRHLPGARRVYAAGVEVALATSLGLQLETGMALLPAVETAIAACSLPEGPTVTLAVLDLLKEGEPLFVAMRAIGVLRKPFLSTLAAGEEVGKLVETLSWNARLSKIEYDQSLAVAMAMLEPFVMAVLGFIVGLIALGSLLPTMQLLQQ